MSDAAFDGPFLHGRTDREPRYRDRGVDRSREALEREIGRYVCAVARGSDGASQRRADGKADRGATERLVTALCYTGWAALGLLAIRVIWYLWTMM